MRKTFIGIVFFCLGCQDDLGSLQGSVDVANRAITPSPVTEMTAKNGLVMWLDAEKVSGSNQQVIGEFLDQSGNGNDARQTVTNKSPILIKNAINGKSVLRFDGVNDQLDISGSKLAITGAFDVFVVFRTLDTTNSPDPGVFGNGIGGHFQITHHLGTEVFGYVGSGVNHAGNKIASLVANYAEWSWDGTRSINGISLWTNNRIVKQITSAESPSKNTDYRIGVSETFWAGDFAEVLLFKRVLAPEERTNVQTYLKSKYGL